MTIPTNRSIALSEYYGASFPSRKKSGADENPPKAITLPANLEKFGIGGHEKVQGDLIKNIILPHLSKTYEKYGDKKQSGVLLWGPPGTGKTLMARSFKKIFESSGLPVEVEIVNGPEVLDKHVGGSAENIRKLFSNNKEGVLTIIIFDEIEAIGAARGTSESDKYRQQVLTQILTMMNGLDSSGNVIPNQPLVIGMTNRPDILDPALMRRLEQRCYIGLPDRKGRLQILSIHTQKLRNKNLLEDNVNLEALADATENYSGSDLKDLVKQATQLANTRNFIINGASFELKENVLEKPEKVTIEDFREALQSINSETGITKAIQPYLRYKYIPFNEIVQDFIKKFLSSYSEEEKQEGYLPSCWLIDGKSRSGKTALAVHFTYMTRCSTVLMLSPQHLDSFNTAEIVKELVQIQEKAQAAGRAIIILDDLDGILGNMGVDSFYMPPVLEQISSMFTLAKKGNNRITYIATTRNKKYYTSNSIDHLFNKMIFTIPQVNRLEELKTLYEAKNIDQGSLNAVAGMLPSPVGKVIEQMEFQEFLLTKNSKV